jgi:O-antigen ligase
MRLAMAMAVGAVGTLAFGVYLSVGDSISGVSTQLRADSYTEAIGYFASHPLAVILGTDPTAFHRLIDANLVNPTVRHISENAPVHNLLVETLVAGGIVAAGSLVLLSVVPFLRIARNQLIAGHISPAAATAMAAVVIGVIEASVTPAIANSGALWIALGWAVAVAAPALVRTTPDELRIAQEDRQWRPWRLPWHGASQAVVPKADR